MWNPPPLHDGWSESPVKAELRTLTALPIGSEVQFIREVILQTIMILGEGNEFTQNY